MIIEVLKQDRKQITYRPELNKITGSVTATILLQQILFRWANHDNKPFYKFKQPCQHVDYRDGDSWTEELGFSRSEFDTALGKIGAKVKKEDKIPDDCFVFYWTDIDRKTWYGINESALRKATFQLYVKPHSDCSYSENPALEYKEQRLPETTAETLSINSETQNENAEPSTNGHPDTNFLEKDVKAAQFIIAFLESNQHYLSSFPSGDWRAAVRSHCTKLQRDGSWFELDMPDDESQKFRWIGKRIGGAKSWLTSFNSNEARSAARRSNGRTNNQEQPPALPKFRSPAASEPRITEEERAAAIAVLESKRSIFTT